jgi:hypothetical protein
MWSIYEIIYAGRQWLTSVIPATQEAEIRRIADQSQPRQIVLQDPISKLLKERNFLELLYVGQGEDQGGEMLG